MATTVGDVKVLVLDRLTNNDAISSIVQGRVYGEHPDLADAVDVAFPCISVQFTAGRLLYAPVVQAAVFEVWCYSRQGAGQATTLYDACVAALQAERLTLAGIGSAIVCVETQRPQDGYDATTRTWVVEGRWVARGIG